VRAGPIYFYVILQTIVILAADCLSQFTEAKVPGNPANVYRDRYRDCNVRE